MKNPEPQGASPKRKRRLGAAPLFGDMLIPSQKSTAQSLRVGRDEPAATSGLATGHLNSARRTRRTHRKKICVFLRALRAKKISPSHQKSPSRRTSRLSEPAPRMDGLQP